MTQTIIKIPPVSGGSFDPTDITISDNTNPAFLVQDSSTEFIKISTVGTGDIEMNAGTYDFKDASGNQVLKFDASNSFRFGTDSAGGVGAYRGVGDELIIDCLRSNGVKIINKMRARGGGHGDKFRVNSGSVTNFEVDQDSDATFTLDDASGAVFKIVDDDSSPRTYFSATENGAVLVDGVEIGRGVLRNSDTDDNVAVGLNALSSTASGTLGNSTAVGFEAGKDMTTGHSNSLFGKKAGENLTTADNSTAIGCEAMQGGTVTGDGNTAVGSFSMRAVIGGANNVALGYQAGDAITSGSGNIAIGQGSDCAAAGVNQIAIGNGVVESTNNRASIGDSSNVATLDFSSTSNSWSQTSDVRIKENIQDSDLGLAFVNSLRPVKHTSKDPTQWPEEIRPDQPSERTPEQLEAVKDGLIAQEVKASADALGTSFSGWEQDENGLNRLQYERFVVPLIKAVQELSAQVEELKGDK